MSHDQRQAIPTIFGRCQSCIAFSFGDLEAGGTISVAFDVREEFGTFGHCEVPVGLQACR